MLTSYLVKCPQTGCDWFGSLLPRGDAAAWPGYAPTRSIVVFECPRCGVEWSARVVGEDVVPVAVEELSVT